MIESSQTSPLHILYADDSESDAFIMKWCLGKLLPAAQFTWFSDGLQLLSYLEKSHPYPNRSNLPYYIILLDINMPGLDGFEVVKRIKAAQNKELHTVPIIMISSSSREQDIAKSKMCGAQDYLIKATSYEDTMTQLKSFIETWANHSKYP